ncbi:protein FAR1-RELATED SEQUENCE 6-like [Phoenix dactylifera]|uniref:Protein FAR1-RELATED SEQUENCE n=1 Tax=Phoenix dactylifera TaxID=42345 RepID=A0A8B7CKH0_PHODC|nr:protein FAR1-RELATED SEQUENCE 6-like [Phoenix dactylifera]XP_008800891.2 protein FAR1-RELATED SEQUENCE 6-like [Phoenix dactylifera]
MEEPSARSKNPRRARLSRRDLNSKDLAGDGAVGGVGQAEGLENDESDGDSATEGGYDGVPEVGMVFKTHQEVSKFYKRYARRVGFGVSVRRSSFTKEGQCLYLELMCCKGGRKRPEPKYRKRTSATTNCPAKIRVKLWGDGLLHLELANLDHNHPVSPSMARFLSCYKQLEAAKKRGSEHVNGDGALVQPEELSQFPVDRLRALEELLFSESEHRSFVERGRLRLGEGDAEALRLFFTLMQAKNSDFFNVIDLDEEGCVRNVFWADARSRAAYQYYNDVVALDTTYVTNNYDLPLATFVGVNHHGQPVLLGCSLLSDETTETYVWLLKAWIACMSGHIPKALISDHCKGIQSAVSEVLPGIRHRLCSWQIIKKVPEKLGGFAEYRAISKAMQKAVYDSLTVDEFEEDWRRMIEIYGLQENEWQKSLYECRHTWAPVYLKDTFWAGMSPTQRSETMNTFFDGYIDAKTSLKQFLCKYEMALQSKYEKEAQADFETFHKRRPSVSKFYMEEQLSKVYTLNMFKKFQDEIEAIMYCHASLVKSDGPVSTFNVKECIFLDDGKRTMNRNHGVLYNTEQKEVQCICGSFQFRGILCRHALSVFKLQQVHEIPSQYILDRWKKDFKRLHVIARSSNDVVANNRVDRYDYLSMRCLQLVEVGVLSDKYQLALKLMREMEKFLLSDSTHDDTQPKIKPHVPKTNKLNQDINQSVGKIAAPETGNEMRRRGRPPQTKQSQASLGTSKEGVNPQVFPTGSQFGVPMHHPQYIGHQAAMRPSIVYMFPGGFDPQTFGNGPMMPWIYQQMFQAAQKPKDSLGPRAGRPTRKRKIYRGHKPVEATQEPKEPPAPAAPATG